MNDKLHRFIDIIVPVKTCNLRCHYCYITQNRLFESKLPEFHISRDVFRKSLSQTRLGGKCLLNFCGAGETLLPPEMPDYISAALDEGHFVMIVTNGTVTSRLKHLAKLPAEYLERLFFKFSFHYLELKERGLLDIFRANVQMMRDAGASFSVEVTPSDELIPYITDLKEFCMKHFGALCHITVARNERNKARIPMLTSLPIEQYKQTWGTFASPLFDFKMSVFEEKRREFCYAGHWSYFLEMETGLLFQCYSSCALQNFYASCKALRKLPVGHFCPFPHCYNAHVFLGLGVIPFRGDPTYAAMRNRICVDGSEWLRPRMKDFLSQKLSTNNRPYYFLQKILSDVRLIMFVAWRLVKRAAGRWL